MTASPPNPQTTNAADPLPDAAQIYDRQIRVWGVSAQKQLSSAHLVFFATGGILAEMLKNLVLAGVGRITIVANAGDLITQSELDLGNRNLLLRDGTAGLRRAEAVVGALRELNPLVRSEAVYFEGGDTSVILQDASLVFSGVVVSPTTEGGMSHEKVPRPNNTNIDAFWLSRQCLNQDKTLFLFAHAGERGFCFVQHAQGLVAELGDSPPAELEAVCRAVASEQVRPRNPVYADFLKLILLSGSSSGGAEHGAEGGPPGAAGDRTRLDPDFLRLASLPAPLAIASSLLAGVMAQEAMKCITRQTKPLRNCFLCDLDAMLVTVEDVASGVGGAGGAKSVGGDGSKSIGGGAGGETILALGGGAGGAGGQQQQDGLVAVPMDGVVGTTAAGTESGSLGRDSLKRPRAEDVDMIELSSSDDEPEVVS